jgi:hypothetical protein
MPETYGELFDSYRGVWSLLVSKLDTLPKDEKEKAIGILLQRARALSLIQNLSDMVLDTMSTLLEKDSVDKKELLTQVLQILHYEGEALTTQTRQRWEQIRDQLTGTDFSSRLRRYVGMNLLVDKVDQDGNIVDDTQSRIDQLAHQALENTEELEAELEWLVTEEAQNGFLFGYSLGSKDKKFSLLQVILDKQRNAVENASGSFLGGYFRSIFESDRSRWEKQLDELAEDKYLNTWVPEATWRSGMSDQAAIRIIGLAANGTIGFGHFRMFSYGRSLRDVSEEVFQRWIRYLLGVDEIDAIYIALELFHSYYGRKDVKHKLPEELTLKVLAHPLLFESSKRRHPGTMDVFHWTELGKHFIALYPKRSLDLANTLIEHFGEEGTILEGFYTRTQSVLGMIAQEFPYEVWKRLAGYLGPPIDTRAFHLRQWLRGDDFFGGERVGVFPIFPLDAIWQWVDEAVDERAWYLASIVPNKLFRQEDKPCLARQVLIRYGDRDDVRRNLMANFSTGGWSGLESAHHERRKQELLEYKDEETDEQVRSWIDDYVSEIDHRIEQARIEEERES